MVLFFALSILLLVLAIPLLLGFGGHIIAGFLVLSADDLEKIGPKRVGRVLGSYLLLTAIGVFSLLYSTHFPWLIWLLAAAIVAATVALILWIHRLNSQK